MKSLPVLLLVLFAYGSHAQYVPDSVTGSAEKFAGYLQSTYKDPSDGIRTLYSWISSHIRYDKDSAMYFNWSVDHQSKVAATLRRRKGVCENYAALLADIAGRMGITSYVVHGYPANAGNNDNNSHSWVALRLNEEWYLCDPTWDAQASAEKYYMRSPSEFIQTHIPFDPLWQLLEKPLQYKNGGSKFMYKDSANAYLQLDSLQQLLATERRIKNAGAGNNMTHTWERYNRMNIAVIAGEKDEHLYNSAVELLNKANSYFNAFVQYRNQQFSPAKTDAELREMLQPVAKLLKDAGDKLNKLGSLTQNFQYDTGYINEKIATLEKKTGEQQLFLKQYLETIPAERMKLFYK